MRTAFVTGASRGIGRATAVALAEAGNRVAFCYAHDEDGAKETQAAIEATGADALALHTDVGDREQVGAAFDQIENTWAPVEILVNNAGINEDGLIVRMGDDAWDDVIRVNLTSTFATTRRATGRMMRARFGRIVNVSSVGAYIGAPGQANYAAAKAGIIGLTRSVAKELAPRGITCNVVAPGPIVTPMLEGMGDEWEDRVRGLIPLGRFGTPEEAGAVIAFLCSDAAAFVTGALVPVDGGLGMGH